MGGGAEDIASPRLLPQLRDLLVGGPVDVAEAARPVFGEEPPQRFDRGFAAPEHYLRFGDVHGVGRLG